MTSPNWILTLLCLAVAVQAGAVDLRFQYADGDQLVYDGRSVQTLQGSDVSQEDLSTLRIVQTTSTDDTEVARVIAETDYSTTRQGQYSRAQATSTRRLEYSVDRLGNLLPDAPAPPVVRGVPSFPSRDLQVGDYWTASASESIDLNGIAVFAQNRRALPVFVVDLLVSYKLVDVQIVDERKRYQISVTYSVYENSLVSKDLYRVYPMLLAGMTRQTIWFDADWGILQSSKLKEELSLLLSTGDVYRIGFETEMTLERADVVRAAIAPEVIAEALPEPEPVSEPEPEPEPQPEPEPEVMVAETQAPTAQPVILSEARIVANVYFEGNSSVLSAEAQQQIRWVAAELLSQPQTVVLIDGSEADVPSPGPDHLSLARAAVVGGYLLELGCRPEQLLYRGLGTSRQVAPNDTESHRQENRRVDLLFVEAHL